VSGAKILVTPDVGDHSGVGLTTSGESGVSLSCELSMTISSEHPRVGIRSLNPTKRQVLSNYPKYVTRFWHINYFRLMSLIDLEFS
jgi:hypothetical protein